MQQAAVSDVCNFATVGLYMVNTGQRRLKPKTYDEVSSLIGAGKESGWMSVHLVLQSGRSAIFCLSTQSVPELICEQDRHLSSYSSFMYLNRTRTYT